MPQFEYKAIDRQGKTVQGTVQADTRDEAARSLSVSGLLVSSVTPSGGAVASSRPAFAPITQSVAPLTQPRHAPAPASQVVKQPVVNAAPAARPSAPSLASTDLMRTRRGRDKDLYFVFSQLASYAKAGINLAEACGSVAKTTRRSDYAESLKAASQNAERGGCISDTFARYVDLYPPHIVGLVRACEEGGFFPEGMNKAADQTLESHKFKRWFNWLGWIAITSFGCMPLAVAFFRAMKLTFTEMTGSSESLGFWDVLFKQMGKNFAWPTGPISILVALGLYVFHRWITSRPQTLLRHRWILHFWGIKKRAQSESFALFGWSMSMLTRIGLAPRAVWFLSTATMPNQWMRKQLDDQAALMSEQTKLSEVMNRSKVLPEEFAPFVSTGEITGDVPGQLARIASAQYGEFNINDKTAKGRIGCWIVLVFVVCGFLIYILYAALYLRPTMDEVLHWAD